MVLIRVQGVDCYYDSEEILENISFKADEGEFLGILGPNGAGKTTLLNTLCGQLKPRVGTVLISGEDISGIPQKKLAQTMAVVPQTSPTYLDFTVLDIVLMGRSPHLSRLEGEGSRDFQIALEAMATARVSHLARKSITQLSGGERQRVIIARALAQEPQILLLDEPTLHLDISNQLEIMEVLRNLCREKKLLIIAVFHDFNLAVKYCNRLLLLHKRKIVALGEAEEVLTKDNVAKVFGVDVYIRHHPLTNSLYFIPLSATPRTEVRSSSFKVHLICGGGSGAYLMKRLTEEGFTVSTGVLNILDSDYEVAQQLPISTIPEAPFSPITEHAHQANVRQILSSDAAIISDFPLGSGNLRNLEAAQIAASRKIPVIIIKPETLTKRDFTGGKAEKDFKELVAEKVLTAESYDEAVLTLKRLKQESASLRQAQSGDQV